MTRTQRFLTLYSAVVTVVFAATVLTGFAAPGRRSFDAITVHRIDVVEPDGTLRMVISNHDRLPGVYTHGEERPLERPQAGMLFLNDEGTEVGGLVFGGHRDAAGKVVDSGVSLSFDRYEANQIVSLYGVDDSSDRFAGLAVTDSPSGSEVNRRIWLGRGEDGIATLALMDAAGRRRLLLEVEPDGGARFVVLDADGEVVRELIPAAAAPAP